MNNKEFFSKLGGKLGQTFAVVCSVCIALCFTAIVVALTTKFIFWLF